MKTTTQNTRRFTLSASALSLALGMALASTPAIAELEGTVHLGKSDVSREEVIRLLSPSKDGELKTRGLRLHNSESKSDPVANAARALSMEVYFAFDSAQLSEEAMQQLAPVGEALQSDELGSVSFTLEGHTDASGDDSYNLYLSEKRAQSVKEFFIRNYSLSPERVAAVGKGESEILDSTNPTSGVNRRVTIVAE